MGATGVAAERRLIVRHGSHVREVLLVGTVSVGRNPSCEISEADPLLSREHAEFRVTGTDVVVRDLGSRNGTRVNGKPIKEERLAPGDRVEVGPLVIEYAAPIEVESVAPGGSTDDEATVVLPRRQSPAAAAASRPVPGPSAPSRPPPLPPPVPPMEAKASVRGPAVGSEHASPRGRVAARPSTPVASAPAAAASNPTPQPGTALAGTPPGMAFGRTALLWLVPVALVAFVMGSLPSLMESDVRGPLLSSHYATLARAARDLVSHAPTPAATLDDVVNALRGYAGVTQVRVLESGGRVLAPTADGGTVVAVPEVAADQPLVRRGPGRGRRDPSGGEDDGRPKRASSAWWLIRHASSPRPAPLPSGRSSSWWAS